MKFGNKIYKSVTHFVKCQVIKTIIQPKFIIVAILFINNGLFVINTGSLVANTLIICY